MASGRYRSSGQPSYYNAFPGKVKFALRCDRNRIMLPPSHIGYTLLTFRLAQKWVPAARRADYRLLAVASLVPDLLDKPFVLATYHRWAASKLLAHTGLWHLLVLLLVFRRKPEWWPYALAVNGHLLADAVWHQPDTLFWPGRGRHFHRRQTPGWYNSSFKDYLHHLLSQPRAVRLELGGGLALLLFIWLTRLFRPASLWRFLRSGRV